MKATSDRDEANIKEIEKDFSADSIQLVSQRQRLRKEVSRRIHFD